MQFNNYFYLITFRFIYFFWRRVLFIFIQGRQETGGERRGMTCNKSPFVWSLKCQCPKPKDIPGANPPIWEAIFGIFPLKNYLNKDLIIQIVSISRLIGYWTNYHSSSPLFGFQNQIHSEKHLSDRESICTLKFPCETSLDKNSLLWPWLSFQLYFVQKGLQNDQTELKPWWLFFLTTLFVCSQLNGGWIWSVFTCSIEGACFVCLPTCELFSRSRGMVPVVLSAAHAEVKDGCPLALLSPLIH